MQKKERDQKRMEEQQIAAKGTDGQMKSIEGNRTQKEGK
jgi:hypothetical protein